MTSPSAEDSLELRAELLEVLKQLNRDDEEDEDVPGLELSELHHLLARGPLPQITRDETRKAVELLVTNGLVRELDDSRYAWARARVVTVRFAITPQGKEFLVRSLEKVGRI